MLWYQLERFQLKIVIITPTMVLFMSNPYKIRTWQRETDVEIC